MRLRHSTRRSAVIVESAFVMPVAIVIVIAIVSGALAVATYQQVSAMSREATRYASVRGEQYSRSTGYPAATRDEIYNNVILPRIINMDPNKVTWDVTWNPDKKQGSTVTVWITYLMSVPIYGDMTFTSTSTMPITW